MKVSKIFASFAAAAVAASAMAISAFAAVTKVEPVKLNSKSEGDKIVQYDVSCIGTEKVTSVQIIGTLPADTWFGGGGAFGFDTVENEWVQVDFEIGKSDAYKVDDAGNIDVTLDFTGKDATPNLEKEDGGIAQLGWWWGSGDGTLDVSDILVNGVSIMGNEAIAPAPAETEAETEAEAEGDAETADEGEAEVVEDDAEPVAEEEAEPVEEDAEPVVEEDAAPAVEEDAPPTADENAIMTLPAVEDNEVAPAETAPATAETAPVKTGNTAAATIAVVMVAAGAAALISKRK